MNFIKILSILLIFRRVFGFFVVLIIIRKSKSLNKDIPWVVLILLFPFVGSLIYLFLGSDIIKSNLLQEISMSIQKNKKYFIQDKKIRKEILRKNNNSFVYLLEHCNFPITKNNKVIYFSSGEIFFDNVKTELKKAKKFIFIEFFSIEIGSLWEDILDILKKKVQAGVEVRIIYDSVACVNKIPFKYYKELEKFGIQCEPFYKNKPLLCAIRNHREHRKCVIIDGRIAFTGGVNIEDRYINLEQPYGHWKDVGISICGNGVWNFTVMFLSMWNALSKSEENFTNYQSFLLDKIDNEGYIVPFCDNPLDKENVCKNAYISMINQAQKSLFIFTPYLILDMDIHNALTLAAKRGVDVIIIIPGIPDKKFVYQVSLLEAKKLLKEKVKVYTYTPGFLHGKVFLVDNKIATIGTMNTDYRSLYFDFEYGVLIEDVNVISDIKKDIDDTLQKSDELKLKETKFLQFLWEAILQLFAPLM